MFELLTTRLF